MVALLERNASRLLLHPRPVGLHRLLAVTARSGPPQDRLTSARAAAPVAAVAPTNGPPRLPPTRRRDGLAVGVTRRFTCAPPTVRIAPPVEREGEEGGAGNGQENDDAQHDAIHGSPPHGADAAQRISMALGRLAYKVGDRQASRTSQAGLADLLGVAVAQRRLGPSSSATTSTTERALPSSAVQLCC